MSSESTGDRSVDDREPAVDRALVYWAQRGEHQAMSRLARELLPRVRNLVRYLIRGDADVDDVAQEALVAVLRGLPSFEGSGSFRSWSDRVVARACFGWLRRGRLRRIRERAALEFGVPASATPMPDEYVNRRRLVEALDRLPADQRYALALHHVLGMTVPEIAAEIAAPTETVRTRLRTARSHLRTLLGRDEVESSSNSEPDQSLETASNLGAGSEPT